MPMRLDTDSRTGAVTAACNQIIAEDGIQGLTMRAIGRVCGVSPASLHHHYTSKERLLGVVVRRTGRARHAYISGRARTEGPMAFLPAEPDDVIDARCWQGWLELWRSEPSLEPILSGARAKDRALLALSVDYQLDRAGLDAVQAMIDGLLVALCAPHRPLPPPRARQGLSGYLGLVLPGRAVTEVVLPPYWDYASA